MATTLDKPGTEKPERSRTVAAVARVALWFLEKPARISEIDASLAGIKKANTEMRRDQQEIERLRDETRALLRDMQAV